MNCRPGDIARVVVPGAYYGSLVSVMYAAPLAQFKLPDGQAHMGCDPGRWVIEALGKPFSAPVALGDAVIRRAARFGVARDDQLRPIRGDGITTEEVKELFSPSPTKESEKV